MKHLFSIAILGLILGCSQPAQKTAPQTTQTPIATPEKITTTTIIGNSGETIGQVELTQAPLGIMLVVEINQGGLTPGWHGLHMHQIGDCSDIESFKKSGGHVGMIKDGHGLMNPIGPEAGDFPNIWAGDDGAAGYETFSNLITLDQIQDKDGTALIIHQNRDDHITQPIGGAGPRVACAVLAKPQ